MLPTWIYARISNENDHAEASIDNQIAICKDYINTNNDLTFGGVFADLGYSGTSIKRPEYSDMIAEILCGKVKCVIVKDLSRLGRAYIEVGELLFDTFVRHGIRFISVNENYDSFADDAGRKKLFVLLKNLINHMYSLDLSKKIKATFELKKQQGEPLGLSPYGYRRSDDKKRFELDSDAAEIVRMIFNMRLQNESANYIAKHLNQNKILSPQHYRYQMSKITPKKSSEPTIWTMNAVNRILHNETYTGSLIYGKYNYNGKKQTKLPKEQWIIKENAHPSIVSKEQFDAVSQLIQKSTIKYKRKNQSALLENHYLGKIFCSRCEKTVTRCENRQGDGVDFYYICRYCNDKVKDKNRLKRALTMPLSKLDTIVMETLCKCMNMLPQFENLIEALSKSDLLRQKNASITRDRAELEKTINNYEKTLVKAYTHHLSDVLDLRDYTLVRDKIASDKLKTEAQLAQIIKEQEKYDLHHVLNNQWLEKYSEFRDYKILTKEMIETFVGRISLTPLTNEVNIELNYMESFKELRQLMQECGIG